MDAPAIVVETPRLTLREVALPDAAFFLALLNDPAWLANIGDRGVHSLPDAEGYIRNNIWSAYRAHGYGMYAVRLKSTAQPIGICGLVRRDFLPGPDLGVALLPAWVRRGYASEAARAVMLHAATGLGIARLYAIVKRGNRPSVRLLERLGFALEGPAPISPEDQVDLYMASLGCASR
jgi:[ribosomal protein S5]-alanine N-acetyltransferase